MTIRPSGVLRSLAGFVGLVLVCAGAATAQESDNSFSAGVGVVSRLRIGANSSSSTSGSNSSSGSDNETAAYLARGYASTMDDDEQRLTIMSDTLLTESVCGGEPMVILKSSTIPANGACLKAQSHYNLSCACFSGFANTTTWHFRIRSPDTAPKSPFPTVISVGDVVEVNSLMLYDTPPTLLILKIQGESSDLVPVNLEKATTGDDELAIVRSQDASSLTKVNLAANKISSIYGSLPGSAEALSAMTDINLANNSFTEFPVQLLKFPNLQKLDMSGNDISNLTVTNDELAIISQLAVFKVDVSSSFAGVDCTSGELLEAHNTEFCVVNGTSTTPAPTLVRDDNGSDSTNWTIFVLVAAFGGCLVGFLLFFLATMFVRHQQEQRSKAGSSSPDAEDVQTSRAMQSTMTEAFYNSLHPTLNADLLDDPLIMSFRLKYKDLHVGRCISKGGFGLVYTGMYKHRQVAIKKIMREKCEKLSQIRMFVREITLMGSLKHERIVEFIGVAWDSLRNLSAITEYMERGDLRDVLHALKHQGPNTNHELTWQGRKLTIALHIAEGLAYMHSLSPKVIHRDLKSKNVLLNNNYDAKLSDFGVSREHRVAEGDGPGRFMTPGVGTSFWIAPEVLLGRDYDEHADIFSFGVVLSEIDTDDYPYWNSGSIPGQDNPDERRSQEQKILEKVALGSLRPTFYNDCPPGILALAASCLEGRPENRPSASEIVLTIKELMREIQLDNRPHPEPEPDDIATEGFLSTE
uniref:Protein kinase domain-containing protein n=1 Tax=Phytophthora ramorum TaxID=164328 RepID=H3GC01_PHYRM